MLIGSCVREHPTHRGFGHGALGARADTGGVGTAGLGSAGLVIPVRRGRAQWAVRRARKAATFVRLAHDALQ